MRETDPPRKLALIYTRVSTEEQARRGYSLPEQLAACHTKAAALGYLPEQIIECVDDEGAPGEFLNRPGLEQARELVRQGNIGAFICMDPDRLSRDLLNQLLVDRELQKAGVRLEFVLFNLERSPIGQAFFSFRGIMSELEKTMIRERTMRGKLGKAKRGGLTHPVGAYGYKFNADTDLLTEDTSPADPARPDLGSKAEILRSMFTWAVDGVGLHAITRRLNDLGLPGPRGSVWHRNTVQKIMRNESYAGTLYLHKHDKRGVRHNRFRPPEERVAAKIRPKDEWIPISVPPLVDHEIWLEAQQQLAQRRMHQSGAATRDYLLSGLVRCGLCGATVHGSTGVTNGKRYSWYICTARSPGLVSKPKCMLPHLRAEPLEDAVWTKVLGWALSPETLTNDLQMQTETAASVTAEREMTASALKELEDARARLIRLIAKGLLTDEQAANELTQLKASETRLWARQQELSNHATPTPKRREKWEELIASRRGRLDDLTFAERREMVLGIVAEVVVRESPPVTVKVR